MKIKQLIYTVILLIAIVFIWRQPLPVGEKGETLTVQTAQGDVAFHIEIAKTEQEQETGLMHRKSLPADYGMLFTFPHPEVVEMWMKNTLIPLDMLFINEGGYVVYVAKNAKPKSLDIITTPTPVLAVLELAGGTAKAKHIEIGNRVIHATFKP